MESAYGRCPACGFEFLRHSHHHQFCSVLCWDVASGRRTIGPWCFVITCDVCNQRAVVGNHTTRACATCAPEWRRRQERLRAATPQRREYKRELHQRRRLRKLTLRWAAAAAQVERTWLALPPGPPAKPERRFPAESIRPRPHRARRRFLTAGYCLNCGRGFVAACTPGKGDRFCSPACGRGHHRRRRRATRVGQIDREAVFAFDHYICQLCGGATDPSAAVPARRAPVLDHIVPLDDGGPDRQDNVQTAHFYCNSLKRELGMDEFVRLYVEPHQQRMFDTCRT